MRPQQVRRHPAVQILQVMVARSFISPVGYSARMGTYTGGDGAQLHYDEHGTGLTEQLIIIGGGAARHPDYLDDLAGLGKKHRLVIPHLRGVGGWCRDR